MTPAFQVSPLFLALQVASVTVMIVAPVVLAVVLTRQLGGGWRYVGFGALVFFLSQMVLRIPLVAVAQAALGPRLQGSVPLQWLFALALAITAGLFESVGRYAGYRWLMGREPKTWAKGVLYGAGHGGVESVLLVAGIGVAQLVTMTSVTEAQLAAMPPASAAALRAVALSWASIPLWLSLGGAVERLAAIAFHVAMSVVVLQVFVRGQVRWLWYAVATHAAFDFVVPFVIPQLVTDPVARGALMYAVFALVAGASLAAVRALRDEPAG